jgi:hypothetical protein
MYDVVKLVLEDFGAIRLNFVACFGTRCGCDASGMMKISE